MSDPSPRITVVGAGMAGSDAALAAARLGVHVDLIEMRPVRSTPAHQTDRFAEMVCSNSFGGESETNAKGLLQAEMRAAGGAVLTSADEVRVPAGGALAVDREHLAERVTERVHAEPLVTVHRRELTEIPSGICVLATGPLTSDALAAAVQARLGSEFLGFYDAASPIVDVDSIDMTVAFRKGRYGQAADYLNLPLRKDDYDRFYEALAQARSHTPHDWEKLEFFEGCMPIEELARRGYDTPRFGPMKPVGTRASRDLGALLRRRAATTGGRPRAHVVAGGLPDGTQVGRPEDRPANASGSAGRRRRALRGDAPQHLPERAAAAERGSGAEGARRPVRRRRAGRHRGLPRVVGDRLAGGGQRRPSRAGPAAGGSARGVHAGRLVRFLASAEPDGFQPMNANWGLVPNAPKKDADGRRMGKKDRRAHMYRTGLAAWRGWLAELAWPSAAGRTDPAPTATRAAVGGRG